VSTDLLSLLRELSGREIEYIVVGGMAAVLQGAPVVTADLDIVHRRTDENVAKLLQLFAELDAVARDDPRRLRPDESHLLGKGHVLLATKLGSLDVLCEILGEGYGQLEPHTSPLNLGAGLTAKVLHLDKLIEQKRSVGRAKDRIALPILEATLEETRRRR